MIDPTGKEPAIDSKHMSSDEAGRVRCEKYSRADKLIDTAAAGIHEMYQYVATPPSAGRPYVWSVYAKGTERKRTKGLRSEAPSDLYEHRPRPCSSADRASVS